MAFWSAPNGSFTRSATPARPNQLCDEVVCGSMRRDRRMGRPGRAAGPHRRAARTAGLAQRYPR
ncbi:hypothetical protein BJ973_003502 [Actinoplanes tereljensis]